MASILNADTTNGLKISSDTSGEIKLQSAGTDIATVSSSGITMASGKGLVTTAPAFSAYMGSDLTLTSGVYTKVPLDTEDFDTTSDFDSTTNYRYTPSVAGYYQINATLRVVATSRTTTAISLYKNGSAYKVLNVNRESSSSSGMVSGSTLIYMNGSSDYIELYGLVNFSSAGRYDYVSSVDSCFFSGFLARAV